MKTAEQLFKDNDASGQACEYGYNTEVVSLSLAISLAKQYAVEVTEQTLIDLANSQLIKKTTDDDWLNDCDLEELKQAILNTEIKTP